MVKILRKPQLKEKLDVSGATIDRWERDGRFPRRIHLGKKSVGWLESEIDDWVRNLHLNTDDSKAALATTDGGGRAIATV